MIFRKHIDVSPSPPPLTHIIITTVLIAIILISSPIMTGFSPSPSSFSPLPPPMVLKVGLASASSSENNGGSDESNTDDATTTADGAVGDVQEGNTEGQHQQVPQQVPQQHQQVPPPSDQLVPGPMLVPSPPPIPEPTPEPPPDEQPPPTTTSPQGGQPSSGLPTPYNTAPPQSPTDTLDAAGNMRNPTYAPPTVTKHTEGNTVIDFFDRSQIIKTPTGHWYLFEPKAFVGDSSARYLLERAVNCIMNWLVEDCRDSALWLLQQ
jgi:outer membrane biosynthesis protein TonB